MPLTWQDVAGQVAAPDFSEAASMITRGIQGIGQSVASIGAAPEARRRQDAEMVLKQAQLMSGLTREQGKDQRDFFKDQDVRDEKKNAKEFGAAQSILEAQARANALSGKPFEELFKSEAYQKLGEGARAYGASHLSDAYMRGDETRIQQQERAADNARAEAQANRSYAQSESHFRQQQAMQARELNLRMEQLKKTEQENRESRGLYSHDAGTNIQIQKRAAKTVDQLAPIKRGMELYGSMTPQAAAKKGGIDGNWITSTSTEAQQLAARVEKQTGKKVDTWMINQLLAEGGGADGMNFIPGVGLNDSRAVDYLTTLVETQDAANYNQAFLNEMIQNARAGKMYSEESMQGDPARNSVPRNKPAAASPSLAYRPALPGWK